MQATFYGDELHLFRLSICGCVCVCVVLNFIIELVFEFQPKATLAEWSRICVATNYKQQHSVCGSGCATIGGVKKS